MKKGFTLAEVLITLSIIGVISAMTIPQLVTANHKKLYSTALASVTQTIETSLINMINSSGVNWLEETDFYEALAGNSPNMAHAASYLGKYMDISGYGTTAADADPPGYTKAIKCLDNSTETDSAVTSGFIFRTKTGALLNFIPETTSATANGTGGIAKRLFTITIDVNGKSDPNKWGRDIFMYAVDVSGKIFPYGGSDMKEYISEMGLWTDDASLQKYSCQDGAKGYGCAGRLAETGFVMDY